MAIIIEIPPEAVCQFQGCLEPATTIAYKAELRSSQEPEIGIYCKTHAARVADGPCIEYVRECPHCGCVFGIEP